MRTLRVGRAKVHNGSMSAKPYFKKRTIAEKPKRGKFC
jgi:hypothetical protein